MSKWTTPADIERKLRRRWDTGEFLRRLAEDTSWTPIALPLRGPTARELADDFAAARQWVQLWRQARWLRVEYSRIGGRLIGPNDLPARVYVDDLDALCGLLRVGSDRTTYAKLLETTREHAPRLVGWVAANPMRAQRAHENWPAILATVSWFERHAGTPVYIRQIDSPGVDTKFVERNRGLLGELLDLVLDPEHIDTTRPYREFAHRYRLLDKPEYIRLRSLDPNRPLPGGYAEATVRTVDLAAMPLPCSGVYVIENEISYLAFPDVTNAVAIHGAGYAVTTLQRLPWLADRALVYWGDIDTHGFAILDRLRARFPGTRSMLMDRATLLAHRDAWVSEPHPTIITPHNLTPDETALYRDLVENTYGAAVRLEQERIAYSLVTRTPVAH